MKKCPICHKKADQSQEEVGLCQGENSWISIQKNRRKLIHYVYARKRIKRRYDYQRSKMIFPEIACVSWSFGSLFLNVRLYYLLFWTWFIFLLFGFSWRRYYFKQEIMNNKRQILLIEVFPYWFYFSDRNSLESRDIKSIFILISFSRRKEDRMWRKKWNGNGILSSRAFSSSFIYIFQLYISIVPVIYLDTRKYQ